MTRVVLDLCAGTGAWSQPYKDGGYYVIRVDLPKDVRLMPSLGIRVDGVLAAPPCTVFANSGARWPRTKAQMLEALGVVDACLRAVVLYRPTWWALENPVGKLSRWLGEPVMYFDPCDYGDPYRKRTALWGHFNLPKLNPVEPVSQSPIHWMSPSKDRAARRAVTPSGFARAFFEANP